MDVVIHVSDISCVYMINDDIFLSVFQYKDFFLLMMVVNA